MRQSLTQARRFGQPREWAMMKVMSRRIDGRVEIGHVHLKVADLERSIAFYSGVLGFDLQQRWGTSAAFLSAGDYHHHIGLNTWGSLGGPAPAAGTTGLYHFAVRYPDRASLGDALRRLQAASVVLDGASDHGVSEALYLRDPDGNGIELYRDRPREEWPRAADGSVRMISAPLDLEALVREAERGPERDASMLLPAAPAEISEESRQLLRELRKQLLNLHKVLLDDAKLAYEMDRGRVANNAVLLQLVIDDPWFAWLHSLSGLIVRIDESVGKDAPTTEADATVIIDQVEKLLMASETGDEFHKRYYEALQRQPAVVLAHADVRRALKSSRRS
jgi:catechol 2,3-dioxygenase